MSAPATQQKSSSTKSSSKRTKRRHSSISEAKVHIIAKFNTTRVTVTNAKGDVLTHGSAGKHFSGARKSTPHAARIVVNDVVGRACEKFGIKKVVIVVKGPGPGRDSAIRGIIDMELEVLELRDATRIPFNGCRPKKRRRV